MCWCASFPSNPPKSPTNAFKLTEDQVLSLTLDGVESDVSLMSVPTYEVIFSTLSA